MRVAAPLALLMTISIAAEPARAEPARSDEARRGDAKAIATRGDTEFYAGRCDRAIPLWRQAEAAYHAPTILLRIARCEAILGRVVAATATLEAVGREPLEADAPPAFFMARDQARREVASVRGRIATLEIAVDALDRAPVAIEIDGAARGAPGRPIEVDPGERSLRVRAGASSWESSLRLRDGERLALRISLGVGQEPAAPRVLRGLGIASVAMGGAAVAVGLGLSVGAAGERDAGALATAARATLATGAVLAAAGAITILAAPARGETWRVRVGAASLTLEGRF